MSSMLQSLTSFDSETLATLCGAVLQDRCGVNKNIDRVHRSRYHSSRVPAIPVTDYLKRIAKYSRCSPESLLIAIIYLDRYVAVTRIPITFFNVHRLIIVSVLVAAKIRDDIYYSNAYYGSIGGVHLEELNELELDFVKTLNWTTFVSPEEYRMYLEEIVKRYSSELNQTTQGMEAARKEGSGVKDAAPVNGSSPGALAGASSGSEK